ncbi:hypothetical protein AB833_17755 [Chromatiales bacterium (ex Bugula neritina AB1)]|nr:hypothetical protein AB833_17755 [Chromatiales bacterium (ex Bugula neritina AB1)]
MNLDALLKHPGLWKGRQQHEGRETISTGHPGLDAALPAQGWPLGALTELMVAREGIGELSLLLPALDALTRQQQWVALVAPPHIPYAPALTNAGISLERMLIVDPEDEPGHNDKNHNDKNAFWAAEQLLRSGVFSAVILWTTKNSNERQQRRLQLAAEQGKAWAVCYRPERVAKTSSPAGLRMVLRHNHGQLQIDIIKNRGGRLRSLTHTSSDNNQSNTSQVISSLEKSRVERGPAG